jgi:ParB family transcriptional regulator, chromosome partitioning protein
MADIKLKTDIKPFEAVLAGVKTFELRFNDREFRTGDVLILDEWDKTNSTYTGRCIHASVIYILFEGYGLPEGYVIMSIRPFAYKNVKDVWVKEADTQA